MNRWTLALLILAAGILPVGRAAEEHHPAFGERVGERELMVRQQLGEIRDARVLDAMRHVPRHAFVPAEIQPFAYADHALPIGYEQTISQPLVVAHMTEQLSVQAGQRVLELGTGSGYQAAVLAELGAQVYSVEIVGELAERAAATLKDLCYESVHVKAGDGYYGWPEHAPFERIIITFAVPEVPLPVLVQLAPGGKLVCPLGGDDLQWVTVFTKDAAGRVESHKTLPVRFVPMTGERGDDPPAESPFIDLPTPSLDGHCSVEKALAQRRSVREYAEQALTLAEIGQLLWAAQGSTSSDGFRTAPSAGATYPLEAYVVVKRADGLEPGLYHYLTERHGLERLQSGDVSRELSEASRYQECVSGGAAAILLGGFVERTAQRYGARAERYMFMEAGHAAQNVLLEAEALGLAAVPVGAFDDQKLKELLGSGAEPLYIISIGHKLP